MNRTNKGVLALALMGSIGACEVPPEDAPEVLGAPGAAGEVETSQSALTAGQIDGIYAGDDGGSYYVRFLPARNQIFWYGEHPAGAFANVASGPAFGTPTTDHFWSPRWLDVPKGRAGGAGNLSMHLSRDRMVKLDGPTFGGNNWTKLGARPPRAPINVRAIASGPGATGAWIGSDRGVYFVREVGSELSWFGQVCSFGDGVPISGNVFAGTLAGRTASGPLVDVPYGFGTSAFDLTLNIGTDSMFATAGVPGRSWSRVRDFGASLVSSVSVKITTGGDDLRGGAVAYGQIELAGGRLLPRENLNRGARFGNNSVHVVSMSLPAGTRVRDLVAFTLEHDGAPRNVGETYDNWNADAVQISFTLPAASCPLQVGPTLTPGRLTGERTFVRSLL